MSKKYIIKNGTAVEVSDEVYKILRKWDRRVKYVEHDLCDIFHLCTDFPDPNG